MSRPSSTSVSPSWGPPWAPVHRRGLRCGFGRPLGAFIGGIMLGLAQSIAIVAFGARLKNVAAQSVLVIYLLIRPGGILGADTTEGRADVEPGSTLVMYTDGLIERRGSDIGHGIDQLVEATAAGDPNDLDGFCDHLLEALDADNRGDDIALLAARLA
jgi:uncharacterized membrane protein